MAIVTAIPYDLVAPRQVIHKQAHPNNYSSAQAPIHGGYRRRTKASAIVIHTPEEPADAIEVTPFYFARDLTREDPPRRSSTDAYADNDGDLYIMVSDEDSPFANGVSGNRVRWKSSIGQRPPWYVPGISYNCYTRSIEVEGYAATIGDTLTPAQYNAVKRWATFWCLQDDIPATRNHIVGHGELDTWRSDPGTFPLDQLANDVASAVSDAEAEGVSPELRINDPALWRQIVDAILGVNGNYVVPLPADAKTHSYQFVFRRR